MKYIIELTDKQRKRFEHMNKALIKMGMGFDILSLLKPINVEDTSEYQEKKKAEEVKAGDISSKEYE